MHKLNKIYDTFSVEIEGLLKSLEKTEVFSTTHSKRKLLSSHNIVSQLKENIVSLKEAIFDLEVKLNLVVLGKFNSGKSSFINRLVGKDVAVVAETEMTFALNYITYGDEEKSRIVYENDSSEYLDLNQLRSKIMVGKSNKEFTNSIKFVENCFPYKEIESINIWDSPGLGGTNHDNKLRAVNIMQDADVVLWVMDCTAIGDIVDKQYILQLVNQNIPIICIINKIDLISDVEDYKSQILEILNSNYPNVFKDILFCSSYQAPGTYLEDGIDLVKKVISDKIYKKKKELILASKLNRGVNLLQNIYDTIEAYSNNLKERIDRYNIYTSTIKSKIEDEILVFKKHLEVYLDNHLFKEEFEQISIAIRKENPSSQKQIKAICSQYINDKSLQKYIEEIEMITKSKYQDIWQQILVDAKEDIYLEEKYFYISNLQLVQEDTIENDNLVNVPTSMIEKTFAPAAAGTIVGILVSSSIFLGLLFGIAAWIISFLSSNKKQAVNKMYNEVDKKELQKVRRLIKDEYLTKDLYKRIAILNEKIFKDVKSKAEEEFLNSISLDINLQVNESVGQFLPKINDFKKTLSSELELINSEELFLFNRISMNDFMILRANPNPGIEALQQILSKATGYVYIVDPYFKDKSLGWLKYVNEELSIKIMVHHIDEDIELHSAFITKLKQIRSQRKGSVLVRIVKYKFRKSSPLHDRFIFTSSFGINLGNSLDAIGRNDISVTFLENNNGFKEQFFDKYWNASIVEFEEKKEPLVKIDL